MVEDLELENYNGSEVRMAPGSCSSRQASSSIETKVPQIESKSERRVTIPKQKKENEDKSEVVWIVQRKDQDPTLFYRIAPKPRSSSSSSSSSSSLPLNLCPEITQRFFKNTVISFLMLSCMGPYYMLFLYGFVYNLGCENDIISTLADYISLISFLFLFVLPILVQKKLNRLSM